MVYDRTVKTRTKLVWVAFLYFAQGLPFGIFNEVMPVYLRVHEIGLKEIGLFSLLGLPWSIKVLWAPLVDSLGRFQVWIASCLFLMACWLLLLAPLEPTRVTLAFGLLMLAISTTSATQDVAIDGYTIGLLDPHEVGMANGIRVTAYRVSLILGGGGLILLADRYSWTVLFAAVGFLFLALSGGAMATPEVYRNPEARSRLFQGLLAWLKRPAAPAVFLFVLTYKVGDAAMAPMVKPFWVDRGMSLVEIGLVSTTLGVIATILGALLGGWLTSRFGLLWGLWTLGFFQAGSNLLYAGVATAGVGREAIYFASLFESFSAGLGTAAFLAFLMSICEKDHAATQYALLSALFGFTRSIAGGFSGWGSERFGYGTYFGLTFLLALPAFALLPSVARYLRRSDLHAEPRRG